MRFSIKFILLNEKKELPIHIRNMFMSILKKAFENGDVDIYKKYYETTSEYKNNVLKPFTFSIYIPNIRYEKEKIFFAGNEIILNFSTYEIDKGLYFYNGILRQKDKIFNYKNKYELKVENIKIVNEKIITENEVVFKTLSPLLVRNHNKEKNKDDYLCTTDKGFEEIIKENINKKSENFLYKKAEIDIKEINMKKLIMKHQVDKNREIFINGNSGYIKIKSDIETLDMIYKSGIGARNGEGFGMLEIV